MPTTTTHYGPMTWVGTNIDLTGIIARPSSSIQLDISGWINVVGTVHATQYVFQLRFWDTAGAPIGGLMYSAECGSGGSVLLSAPFPPNAGYWAVNVVSNSLTASTDTAECNVGISTASPFYRNFDVMAGLAYDGSAHHQFGYPMSGAYDSTGAPVSGGIDRIKGLASVAGAPAKAYAWATNPSDGLPYCYRSSDAGATWTRVAQFPGSSVAPPDRDLPDANGTATAAGNKIWVATHADQSLTGRHDGVWTSSDDGATWTRILVCEGVATHYFSSTSETLPRGCYAIGLGTSKLWFVWEVSAVYSSPGVASPPPGQAVYRFELANQDGSGRVALADVTLTATSAYDSLFDRNQLPLRPWGDSFALIPSSQSFIRRIDASGTLTTIATPGSGFCYDVAPLGPATYLALMWDPVADSETIYRSVDSGATWTAIRTLTGPDYPNYGSGQPPAADAFGCWTIAPVAGSNEVFVMGGQGTVGPGGSGSNETAPLTTWFSPNLGATFTAIQDTTAPVWFDNSWMNGHSLGIAAPPAATGAVATSAPLVTIVG